ncbi:MAG: glucan biosynthesis protein, partial [Pseudomonadota bacterium]
MLKTNTFARCSLLQAFSFVALLGIAPASAQNAPGNAQQFSAATVDQLAKTLSQKPYEANQGLAPESVRNLSAKAYSELKFRPERAFFGDGGSPFRVQLNHIGYLYSRGVSVNLVNGGKAWGVPYSPELFDFSTTTFESLTS